MAFLADHFVRRALNKEPIADGDDLGAHIGFDQGSEANEGPYHLHVYSHRHNTHVTVTKPNRGAIISLSCGNLGFKKSGRKTYDAAYQLCAYSLDRLYQTPHAKKIKTLEVVLRGFGPGREAITKVLLGDEGKWLRDKVCRVMDATRLKHGGTRSKKPRRL
ncbi:hypothetical protein P8C59_007859 [Phyllachora maydis]|uniref:Mitochondrial ribosomal protein S11 n=1 Tax=Phyllachora maydis TaxID=1825666 RepID=A0AAD9IAB7_9PEZI|nr:hypothetical protein P8C59_007859 [Phyllachora maydis]